MWNVDNGFQVTENGYSELEFIHSFQAFTNESALLTTRDAPIIGIGRFADNRNRPITMPVSADCYLLCIMMALDTEIICIFI